jgi:hypothetical protein
MKKTAAILLLLILIAVTVPAEAGPSFALFSKKHNFVGKIIRQSGNHVSIRDERALRTHRFFVHTAKLEGLEVGDSVRVYFYSGNNTVISIKKMTILTCGEGQNLGNINGCQ